MVCNSVSDPKGLLDCGVELQNEGQLHDTVGGQAWMEKDGGGWQQGIVIGLPAVVRSELLVKNGVVLLCG